MNRIAVIATHHKAGTVWMNQTFRAIGEALDIRFFPSALLASLPPSERNPPIIVSASHTDEERAFLGGPDVRILHLIRDPRDILISGMHYHVDSDERWLLRQEPQFQGRTYREMLRACSTERERYEFEMRNALVKTMAVISGWDYNRANCFECRYEDLIRDTERKLFLRIVRHLGFSREELPVCRRIFWRSAIFGGKAERKAAGQMKHVRSGEPEQWRNVFDRSLGMAFATLYGDALTKLGYEKNDSWLDDLPEHRPELDLE